MDINSNEVPPDQDSNEKKILKEDILIVQTLIEGYMRSYKTRREVVQNLQIRHRIDPLFSNLVWEKLEEQEEFIAYWITAAEISEINLLNGWLKEKYEWMDDPANNLLALIYPKRAHKLPGPLSLRFGPKTVDGGYGPDASSSSSSSSSSSAGTEVPREKVKHLAGSRRSFGLTDIVSDSTNLEELGALGNYHGSPFLPPSP